MYDFIICYILCMSVVLAFISRVANKCRNNTQVYQWTQKYPLISAWTVHHADRHMLSETRVMAFRYFSGYHVLDRTASREELFAGNDLVDSQDNTCVPVMTESCGKLQAAFDFPNANISLVMSAKIVMENSNDCTALMWTWWVYVFRDIQKVFEYLHPAVILHPRHERNACPYA